MEKDLEQVIGHLPNRPKEAADRVQDQFHSVLADLWAEVRAKSAQMSYTQMKKSWSESFEKYYLQDILDRHHGNVSAAAREARIDRSNLLRLLRKHCLKAENFRGSVQVEEERKAA